MNSRENDWLIPQEELELTTQESTEDKLLRLENTVSYMLEVKQEQDERRKLWKISQDKVKKERKAKPTDFVKVQKTILQQAMRSKLLNPAEKQLLLTLVCFCDYSTNNIVNEQKIPMNQKEIIQLVGWGKTHAIETINLLLDKGIIIKNKLGKMTYYRFNNSWIGM